MSSRMSAACPDPISAPSEAGAGIRLKPPGLDPLLAIEGVRKRFGGVTALDGFDLAVERGTLVSIIGPNGCGKTTLFNVVSGALQPSEGRVIFAGRDITGLAPHRIARLGIARKFQVPGVYPSLSVAENLEVALGGGRQAGGIGTMRAASGTGSRLGELMRLARLEAKGPTPAAELSHGQRQWLEIAMLIGQDARLLLLDEPTAGMTIAETDETVGLVRRLAGEFGKTVVVIEHDMRFVRELGSRVVMMLDGRVFREGDYAAIQADPQVRRAYLGEVETC